MINWSLLLFILIWLFVLIPIIQIGVNTKNNNEKDKKKQWKGPIISGIISFIWTLIVILIYQLLKAKLSFALKIIDNLLNYIWGLIPKPFLLWFVIPLGIAYIWMIGKGILYIIQKHKKNKKGSKNKDTELSDAEIAKLDQLAQKNNAKTAMLFRKIVRQAKKDTDNLYVVKLNHDYWIPIYIDDQFKMIQKYEHELKQHIGKIPYPMIIKLSKTSIQVFDKKTGQNKFRDEINLKEEVR